MIWELEQGETTTLDAILNNQLPPTVSADFDPVALRYTDLELSADAEQFIESALALRRQARELEKRRTVFSIEARRRSCSTKWALQPLPALI